MIHLKFLSSIDEDVVGEGTWHRNVLWLGRSKKAQIIIEDNECAPLHVRIFVDEKGAFCELGPKAPQFHLNGKKIVGKKLLRPGDKIRIGRTEFEVSKFEYRPDTDIRQEMEKKYLDLVKSSPGHLALLERIERELLAIERDLHV